MQWFYRVFFYRHWCRALLPKPKAMNEGHNLKHSLQSFWVGLCWYQVFLNITYGLLILLSCLERMVTWMYQGLSHTKKSRGVGIDKWKASKESNAYKLIFDDELPKVCGRRDLSKLGQDSSSSLSSWAIVPCGVVGRQVKSAL